MRRRLLPIVILVMSATFCPNASRAEIPLPLGQDLFSLDYDLAHRAGVLRQDVECLPPAGPIPLVTMKRIVSGHASVSLRMLNANLPRVSVDPHFPGRPDENLRLFTVSSGRVRGVRDRHAESLPSIIGGFAYRPGRYFAALSFFHLDRARALDPDYTGKKYRGMAGDIETAALYFSRGKISLSLGRSRLYWGPQRINLLLSETAQPLDRLTASYLTGALAFHFLFARLDGCRPDEIDSLRFPERSFTDNRYLVGHRLDLTLHRRLRVGVFETVLYGGEGRPPELYYLNPLQFFHAAQLNENEDDNTILGLDFTFLPGRGASLYGQLAIDDFQIDDQSRGDKEPNELGLMLGLFWAGRIATPVPDVKLEYVRLTNRTYHQRDPRNRYLYRNKLIGHPLGPDADSVALSLRFWPTRTVFAELEAAYRRKGEGSIYKPWDEPWLLAAGEYEEPFPTGVVEKAILIAVRTHGYIPFGRYLRDHFFVSLAAGWGEIRNSLNIADRTATTAWFTAAVSWIGFTDIGLD